MKKAFSMIELLIVLAIMGILVVTFAPNLLQYIEKVKNNKMRSEIEFMKKQAMLFYETHKSWPKEISDFMYSGGNRPESPYNRPYRMDDFYFYVDVPEGNTLYPGSNNGVLKYYYRDYYIMADDAAFSYKVYPIYIRDNSPYTNGSNWFGNSARPGSKASKMQVYFIQSLKDDTLYMILEINSPGQGNISDVRIDNLKISGIPLVYTTENCNLVDGTINITGLTNTYAGILLTLDMRKSWNVEFELNLFNGVTPSQFGFLSKHQDNFYDFGKGNNIDEYSGKRYEFNYRK